MAERRMFAKSIIDSDAFLDMPLSAQALYFHLSMRADDEGFVGNPKRIRSMIGASEDDFKLLLVKRFLLAFDSGVVVIKHWKIHNYIQSDRKKETTYFEEKSTLALDTKKAYIYKTDTECIQNGYSLETQVSIGKTSIDKINIVYDADTHTTIQNLYNSICTNLVECKELTASRKKLIKSCTYSIEDLKSIFEKANKSSFLQGNNNYGFKANFDWLMKKDNAIKVLESIYDDSSSNNPKQNSQIISDKHDYSQDELENLFNKDDESNFDF